MERFYKGLTAGALAGIPMNAWSLTSFALGLTGRRYLDWMGVMLYGRPPESALEQTYALLVHFGWLAFLGALFAYLWPRLFEKLDIFKGMFYALVIAVLTYAVPILLQMPYLNQADLSTVVSNHLGALMWGGVLTYILIRLDKEVH